MSYQINVNEVLEETLNIVIHKPIILLPMFILVLFDRMLSLSANYFFDLPYNIKSIEELTPIPPLLYEYLFITLALIFIISSIVDGLYPLLTKNILENKDIDIITAVKLALKKAFTLIAAGILVGLIVFIGTLFFIIPGLIFAIRYFYTIPFIMLENRGVLDGMRASKTFSSDKKNKTLFLFIVPRLILLFGIFISDSIFITIPSFCMMIQIILHSVFITWFSVIPSYVYIKSYEISIPEVESPMQGF